MLSMLSPHSLRSMHSVVYLFDKFSYATSFNWQVAKLSLQTGFISEYTCMIILENDHLKKIKESPGEKTVCIKTFDIFSNKYT